MKLLCEYLEKCKVVGAKLGVEIETEGAHMKQGAVTPELLNYWDIKGDGSLRGVGAEFVYKHPLEFEYNSKALMLYSRLAASCGFLHNDRTSVHVHVNMLDLNPKQIACCILVALSKEKYLFDTYGDDRENNNYCVPYYWNLTALASIVYELIRMIKSGDMRPVWDLAGKYTSINLATLVTFGTIEFRMARGTNDYVVLESLTKDVVDIREEGIHISEHIEGSLDYLMQSGLISDEVYAAVRVLRMRNRHNVVNASTRIINKRSMLKHGRPTAKVQGVQMGRWRVRVWEEVAAVEAGVDVMAGLEQAGLQQRAEFNLLWDEE